MDYFSISSKNFDNDVNSCLEWNTLIINLSTSIVENQYVYKKELFPMDVLISVNEINEMYRKKKYKIGFLEELIVCN